MQPIVIVAGIGFALLGAAAERLASRWPADEASRRGPGARTAILAVAAALAAAAIVARSTLSWWATLVHLVVLGLLTVLTGTDWEQRRLPHLALDPLILVAVAFVPFNPTVEPLWALVGAASAAAFLWVVGLVVRGGVALGDLYLVAPLGLLVGWPAIFSVIFIAAISRRACEPGAACHRSGGDEDLHPVRSVPRHRCHRHARPRPRSARTARRCGGGPGPLTAEPRRVVIRPRAVGLLP